MIDSMFDLMNDGATEASTCILSGSQLKEIRETKL